MDIPMKRVVVTGLGVISPVGNTVEDFWRNVVEGNCGIGPITRFDSADFKVHLAAEVKDFDPFQYMERSEVARTDPYIRYAMASTQQAVEQSGFLSTVSPERFGVIFGSAIGGVTTCFREHAKLLANGPRRVSPFFVPMFIANMASGLLAIRYNCHGLVMPTVTACATGASAIGEAYEKIRFGLADVMIAGGSEAAITDCAIAGFSNMKALSLSDDPLAASLPFDLRRNGFVMGEGSATLILEEYEHAVSRGAPLLGEICGYGATCDAYHLATPRPDGKQGGRAMAESIRQANWQPGENVYLNAHGTGTPLGDIAESQAVHEVFGEHAARVPVSSTKSVTGHMIGAAGAAEAIVCLLAMRDGVVPPTIGLTEPDPKCDLDYVPLKARAFRPTLTLSNSFGFGGHNVSLAMRPVRG